MGPANVSRSSAANLKICIAPGLNLGCIGLRVSSWASNSDGLNTP